MTPSLNFLAAMAALSLLAFGWTSPVLAGAPDPSDPHYNADPVAHLEQSGKMFQVRLIPGEKKTELFVIGRKRGEVSWKDIGVDAEFESKTGKQPVEFKRAADRYVYEGGPLGEGALHLKVRQPKNKSENFILKLK